MRKPMSFPLRPDITPIMAQTAVRMADIDPLASLRYISPAGAWDEIDTYAAELAASMPPAIRNKAGVQGALKDALNLALDGYLPTPAPKALPAAPYAAPVRPGAPAEDAQAQPAAAPVRKMNASAFLTGAARKARESAAVFLGVGR